MRPNSRAVMKFFLATLGPVSSERLRAQASGSVTRLGWSSALVAVAPPSFDTQVRSSTRDAAS